MKNVFLLGLLLPFLLVACNRAEVTDVRRNPEGGVDITAQLDETAINEVITAALAEVDNTLLRDPQVDLQSNAIIINGEHDRRNGEGRVSGSMTLTLTVQDGALLAQITAVNIEDVDVTDARIARLNERLAAGFSRRADPDNRAINYQSIRITDDFVEFTINAQRR